MKAVSAEVEAEDEDGSEETVPAHRTGRGEVLTPEQFAEARDLYERGEMNLTEVSAKFGVSRQVMFQRFKRAGAVRGSRSAEVKKEKEIESFINRRAEWIEETRFQGYQALRQTQLIARKIVLDATKAGKALGEVDADLRAAGRLNKILCDNVMTSLNLLRADEHVDENALPTLSIEDLTDDEVLQHHKNTGFLDEDATIDDFLADELDQEDDP